MSIALVQSASNTGLGASITVTLATPTAAHNCLVVVAHGASGVNPSVTGITLGGLADNFAQLATAGDAGTAAAFIETWADRDCAGGKTSVVVSWTATNNSGGMVWVYEFSGIAAASILDKKSSAFTTSTQAGWDSGATAPTAQAAELWFGAAGGFQTTITGPALPWNNSAQINSGTRNLVVGYQIVSSTGSADYAGTFSPNSFETASVVTIKAAAAPPPATAVLQQQQSGRSMLRKRLMTADL